MNITSGKKIRMSYTSTSPLQQNGRLRWEIDITANLRQANGTNYNKLPILIWIKQEKWFAALKAWPTMLSGR